MKPKYAIQELRRLADRIEAAGKFAMSDNEFCCALEQIARGATNELNDTHFGQLVNRVERLERDIKVHEADLKAAAGSLLLAMPEPGTEMAKLIRANAMLRRQLHHARRQGRSEEEQDELAKLRDQLNRIRSQWHYMTAKDSSIHSRMMLGDLINKGATDGR